MKDYSYEAVLSRKNEIMKQAVGIDYQQFESGGIDFDYEGLMSSHGITFAEIRAIQLEHGVGNTPLKELKNITKLARQTAKPGYGARIFLKDEAQNDSGSFKARRASIAVYEAWRKGYQGVIAATSGNYGAAVASQAAKYGLQCIIVQECYDSLGIGQPEIIEKARACEAYGAEVLQLSVGPELFYVFLRLLEETGYYNASLYSPLSVSGIETLGSELIQDCMREIGKVPDAVVITNAGGGNVTGTARGIRRATKTPIEIIGASVNLKGLHMASDHDFNRKSFTTGHTGFGVPFLMFPDRSDVPRSAARPLRYLDRYVTVTQGEVFFITEALSTLEGIERGPAGNTSLAAAVALSRDMKEDEIIVVQETEYTGAGKHHRAQLSFARNHGIELRFGNPREEIPGKNIIFPKSIQDLHVEDLDLDELRKSYLKKAVENHPSFTEKELLYLSEEVKKTPDWVREQLLKMGRKEAKNANGNKTKA